MELQIFGTPTQPLRRQFGDPSAPICVVVSSPSWDLTPMSEAAERTLLELARQAGLARGLFQFVILPTSFPPHRKYEMRTADEKRSDVESIGQVIAATGAKILVPLDTPSLAALTGRDSISKWHLSVMAAELCGRTYKVLPVLHPESIFRSDSDLPYLILGMAKLKAELERGPLVDHPTRELLVEPTLEQALDFLRTHYATETLSIDIETRRGQITCCAFAPTPVLGMSIPLLPGDWGSPQDLHKIWSAVRHVLAGPSGKVFQNFIYDTTYFAAYGLETKNLWMDTMPAQKFLYPELDADLATIARMHTREPYWKDERHAETRREYYLYNVKDAVVTLEAALEIESQLRERNLYEAFQTRVMRLAGPASEMCWSGLPIDMAERERLRTSYDANALDLQTKLNAVAEPLLGKPLNPRSPVQVKAYLAARKYSIPVKKGKETSNVTALMKLVQRYPNDAALPLLIKLSEVNTAISRYLKPEPYPDSRMRFKMNIHGAMTGRWSSGLDCFDNGFNAQTIPKGFKSMIAAPPGWTFVELDLKQADARYVAWRAPEPTLIEFFKAGRDIHRFVAALPELFNKPEHLITDDERQLGKKTGHAANYGMRGATHSDACLLEMDLVIPVPRAQAMLDGYHRKFQGLGVWHRSIQDQLRRTRRMSTPMGREYYVYGRLDDDAFRQAYAYEPQSVVVDVINGLIVHTDGLRHPEKHIHVLQVHDSYISMVREDYLDEFLTILRATSVWNPTISLPGGDLQIPVELKVGPRLVKMTEHPI